MEDLVNKTLGQFQIRRELGRGGMAVVYEAYQPALQRIVALKVLPPSLSHDTAFVRRFQQEAVSSAGLRHPNIVTIYDVGTQGPYSFIVMEYLEGRALSDIIRDGGPLPVARAVRILDQVAQALDYAHQRGFIHRDIKPGNVMVGQADHATLTDFGIAKAATGAHLTQTGTIMGTPEYMSPEQIRGDAVDHRADIYALGIVAYEMLTGRVPFSGDTATVLYKQVHEMPAPLAAMVPHAPQMVVAAITRALAKDPAQRFQTAGQFVAALSGAAPAAPPPPTPPGIPASALPPYPYATPVEPVYAPPRSRPTKQGSGLPGWIPWLVGGVGAGLLLCAVVIGIVMVASRPTPTPQARRSATNTPVVIVISTTPRPAAATTPAPPRPTTAPPPNTTPTLTRAQVEEAVKNAVERFQKAKEYSQKTGDTSQLADVLAGQALDRQIELVNQTKAQNCYWDIWTSGSMSYQFLEVRGDNYVRVKVTKTETRHKYCNNQYVAASSADNETYDTSYTVEQINGKWYITVRE